MSLKKITLLFLTLVVTACSQVPVDSGTPTPYVPLPDLFISMTNVSMVDFNGFCLPSYELGINVLNQSDVPANNVIVVETVTGQQVQVGNLGPFENKAVYIPATSTTGVYVLVIDPQNVVLEANEGNNTVTYSAATATPPAMCPPQADLATSTPFDLPTPLPMTLDGLVYADMNLGTIWLADVGGNYVEVLNNTDAQLSQDGTKALIESQGDLLLATPKGSSSINLTNSPERTEVSPQWWVANPDKIVFISRGADEAQQKNWGDTTVGYLSMMNSDGSDAIVLDDTPSYTVPALSPDGKMIAYDHSGVPAFYEIDKGVQPFDPLRFGYQPGPNAIFTSPSFSWFGRWVTWWVESTDLLGVKQFTLVLFDLYQNSSTILHTYAPQPGTVGWLPSPTWNGNEGWVAFETHGEVAAWDLWISRPDGAEAMRLERATNPVWSQDLEHLAYVQWPANSDSYLAATLNIVQTSSWNVQQTILSNGSIPLAWIHPAFMHTSYFPMFTEPGNWLTYSNSNPAYQIQYPPEALVETTPTSLTIHMPIQPSTQMTEKYLSIETIPDSIDNCYAFSPWDGKTLLNNLDLKYYGGKYWETSTDGNRFLMGNYAIYQNGFCYRIQLRMSALSETSPMAPPSRADMDVAVLLNILSTLR